MFFEYSMAKWCSGLPYGRPPPLPPVPAPLRSTQLFLEFARRPATQAEAARANYNSNVLCSKSLSSAGRMMPGVPSHPDVEEARKILKSGVF